MAFYDNNRLKISIIQLKILSLHSLREKSQIEKRYCFYLLEYKIWKILVEELKDKDAHPVVYTYRDAHAVSLGLRYGVGFFVTFHFYTGFSRAYIPDD